MDTEETTTTVKVLLKAAQLSVSDEEFARFVALYPTIRAQADGLYLSDMEPECPALAFDPSAIG